MPARNTAPLTKTFAAMLTHCPDKVRAYGICVARQDDPAKGVCEKEFAALRMCAQQAVRMHPSLLHLQRNSCMHLRASIS